MTAARAFLRRLPLPGASLAAVLLAAAALLAGCGQDSPDAAADAGGDSRFSIGGRGLGGAVDSVRAERQRTAEPGAGGRAAGGTRAGLQADVRAALDSGNAAYRGGDYRAALEQFESIVREEPGVRAAWFGIFMAHRALGNPAAADSAMRRAGMGSSDATELHGEASDSVPG